MTISDFFNIIFFLFHVFKWFWKLSFLIRRLSLKLCKLFIEKLRIVQNTAQHVHLRQAACVVVYATTLSPFSLFSLSFSLSLSLSLSLFPSISLFLSSSRMKLDTSLNSLFHLLSLFYLCSVLCLCLFNFFHLVTLQMSNSIFLSSCYLLTLLLHLSLPSFSKRNKTVSIFKFVSFFLLVPQ
jgi:hypothetical protein